MFALMAEGENIRNFGEGSTHTTIYFPEIRALHICLAPLACIFNPMREAADGRPTLYAWPPRRAK